MGIDPSLLEESREEINDLLEAINSTLTEVGTAVDGGEVADDEKINSLFRNIHTLKGIARILQQEEAEHFIHKLEDLLGEFRTDPSKLTKEGLTALTSGIDLVSDIMESIADGGDISSFADKIKEVEGQLASLDAAAGGGDGASSDEMSDDDAMAMLAEMETPADESTIEKMADESAPDDEMSDDDAMAMLAEMDAPADAAEVEKAADDGASEEMSDDDAMAMLAEMDAPVEATEVEKAANDGASEEMSDDDAMAMLAEMDEPVQPEPVEAKSESPAEAPPAGGDDDDDEEEEEDLEEDEGVIDDPEILSDFLESVHEIFENLDNALIELEERPKDDQLINDIFRNAHTLKGTAGMFGFTKMVKLTHKMENIFDKVRKGEFTVNTNITDLFLICLDKLRSIVDLIEAGEKVNVDIRAELKNLKRVLNGKAPLVDGKEAEAPPEKPKEEAPSGDAKPAESAAKPKEEKKEEKKPAAAKAKQSSTIRVDIERLDVLVNLIGELLVDRSRFQKVEEELRTEGLNTSVLSFMTESIQMFSRHMADIQDVTMKVRMVPIGNAFNKFPRVVRDASRGLKKEIDLIVEGAETELDKTLVEEIADPLVHLIRNSVDHGIEMPDVREEKGKPRKGTIWLRSYQEGNNVVIEIKDNGKGIPVEVIRRKAIEKNVIKESDILSKKEIVNLIFAPGFSTAEQVTNLSGRGVGMDVVKRNISKLKGIIDVDTEEGEGTTMSIKVPLTIGILQSLVVNVAGEIFAIPLGNVIESLRISASDVQVVNENEVITLRNQVLPLIRLEQTFNLDERDMKCWYASKNEALSDREKEKIFIVVVGLAEKRIGLVVDNLVTQQEVVIKSMGKLLTGVPGFSGGMVLGNGNVALILDIPEIVESNALGV